MGKVASKQVLDKSEGAALYRCWSLYLIIPLFFLLAMSFVWPLLPNSLFATDWFQSVDVWWRAKFQKLVMEGAAYDSMGPIWGVRYVVFIALCWSTVAIVNLILIWPTAILTWKFGHPLDSEQKRHYWTVLIGLAFFGYAMFGVWLRLDEADPGHRATTFGRTWLVYPLSAVIAGFVQLCLANLVVLVTKSLRHRTF